MAVRDFICCDDPGPNRAVSIERLSHSEYRTVEPVPMAGDLTPNI
jgi:hypothetical protein